MRLVDRPFPLSFRTIFYGIDFLGETFHQNKFGNVVFFICKYIL